MNYDIDTKTMYAFANGIENEIDKIDEVLKNILKLAIDMDKIYNTDTGVIVKRTLEDYANMQIKDLDNFRLYGEKVKKYAGVYSRTLNDVQNIIEKM